MQLRADIQITTMLKALTDVIIPALPAENKLAVEQAQLVAGMLNLMQFQLPLQFRFDRDELQRLITAADALKTRPTTAPHVATAIENLNDPRQRAAAILARCQGDPAELHASILELRAALCALVDASAASNDPEERTQIEAVVLSMSAAQLLRDRALMKPQHWEADHDAVPDITTLLAQ